MLTTTFDERVLKEQLFDENALYFYDFVAKYDEEMVPVMKARGYVYTQWSGQSLLLLVNLLFDVVDGRRVISGVYQLMRNWD